MARTLGRIAVCLRVKHASALVKANTVDIDILGGVSHGKSGYCRLSPLGAGKVYYGTYLFSQNSVIEGRRIRYLPAQKSLLYLLIPHQVLPAVCQHNLPDLKDIAPVGNL